MMPRLVLFDLGKGFADSVEELEDLQDHDLGLAFFLDQARQLTEKELVGTHLGVVLEGSCSLESLAGALEGDLVILVEVEASDVVGDVDRAVVVEEQGQVLLVHLDQPLYRRRGCLGHVQSKEGLVEKGQSFVEVHRFPVGED